MIPSKSLVFQANTVGAGPERKTLTLTWLGSQGLRLLSVCLIGLRQSPCWTELLRERRKWQGLVGRLQWRRLQWIGMLRCHLQQLGGSLRFKVVYDKQTNGAAPSILGVLQWIISTPIITSPMLTVYNSFDHITDPLCVQGNLNSAGKLSKKISLETVFSGTAGTVASIASGSIYLFVSQSGGITTSSRISSQMFGSDSLIHK